MAPHDPRFLLSEHALLLKDVVGQAHLANVVQEGRHPKLEELLPAESQIAPEGEAEHTDVDAVYNRVFVPVLEIAQQNQCVRVSHDAVDHVHDQLPGLPGLDALARPDVVKKLLHVFLGVPMDVSGGRDLLLKGPLIRRGLGTLGLCAGGDFADILS